MEIVKQLAIFLENKPGMLLWVSRSLSEHSINIEAISITDTVDHAIVRLVLDKPEEAIHVLGDLGLLVVDNEMIKISLPNTPGVLANFCQKLIDSGSRIEYAYGSSTVDCPEVNLYVRVMDTNKVIKKLKKFKF